MGKTGGSMENMVIDTFWRGKRVFITGHTGFKGSWLSLWLQKMGAHVTGLALPPPTAPSLFEVANVHKGMNSIIGDIRDLPTVVKAMKNAAPEIVIHMAAQPLVRYSYDNPVDTYATNVMGTVHILEAVRLLDSIKVVVNITSDKCYDNKEWMWSYRENESMGGYDPYSSSKGCAELVTSAYRNSFFNHDKYDEHGVALASARAGNVIGGGDWALDRLIPDIMRAFSNKHPLLIRNPGSIRPWQHVLEPLNGYLILAQALYNGGIHFADGWNFGPRDMDAQPVQYIVDRLTSYWGRDVCWEIDKSPQAHEAHYLKLDCSKANTYLGWVPKWTLDQALNAIVSWHKAHLEGLDMHDYTIKQINDYCKV